MSGGDFRGEIERRSSLLYLGFATCCMD